MLLHRYKITVTDSDIRAHLISNNQPAHWIITANNLPGAWGKFVAQRFGPLKPNPADYDISYHSDLRI